jgi:hypothetical protein
LFRAAIIGTPPTQRSAKRREINAQLSFNTAGELGFRGSLDERETESVRVVVIKTAFSACSRRGLVAKTVATK